VERRPDPQDRATRPGLLRSSSSNAMVASTAALGKLQIRSTSLDEIERVAVLPPGRGLMIAVTPLVEMSWGKQAAQCAHAGQWAWMRSAVDVVDRWDAAGRPIDIVHPDEELWSQIADAAPVQIHDGGYTEVAAGTRTAVAWWAERL